MNDDLLTASSDFVSHSISLLYKMDPLVDGLIGSMEAFDRSIMDTEMEGADVILPFATMNEGKIKEAVEVLRPFGIEVTPLSLDLVEPDVGSIEAVTRVKLEQVRKMGYQRAMVDDAGIFFAAYKGFPGVLTKRVFERIGYRGVMKLLEGETRKAWFEGAVAVMWDGEEVCFPEHTPGHLLEELPKKIRPEPGFPFNPLFVPDGAARTLSEMTQEERQRYSYRGKALRRVAQWLSSRPGVKE
ncbi:non-canonical purine NTP pyrophosphatase [Paludifilum halophilum]|nr:non-canonical purine NTP pyrophosphatase [Paludifilum halophilum]